MRSKDRPILRDCSIDTLMIKSKIIYSGAIMKKLDAQSLSRRHMLKSSSVALATTALNPSLLFAATPPMVETTYGKVRGYRNDDVCTFRGIRYGASTAGANRFMPPKTPASWAGVRDASDYGYSAPQSNAAVGASANASPLSELFASSNGYRSDQGENEDCLFLNVWTKSLSQNAKRPVLVWLHGGGFSSGSASALLYDGTNMASRSDVVVVGINHRLNVFGYTHLGDIGGKDYANSGNVGQLDIILALQWVRDNIERFGGDANRVLIFGESGGGAKVSFLLASPPAKGLFHRAVIESGPGIVMAERASATHAAELLLSELNIKPTELARVHDLPTAQILAAYFAALKRVPGGGLGGGPFSPVLTPDVLPAHPFAPTASPVGADVPVIVGWNRTEATLFQIGDTAAFALDDKSLDARLKNLFADRAPRIKQAYMKAGGSPSDVYFRIASDQLMGANSILLAERKAAQNRAPAYLYRFDWSSPTLDGRLRSAHGMEMPFVFDNTEEGGYGLTGGGQRPAKLAAQMRSSWAAFAETGNPNAAGLPQWRAYDTKSRNTMVFNDESRSVDDPDSVERLAMQYFNPT
jgi:para-nitrobenzyl esterase